MKNNEKKSTLPLILFIIFLDLLGFGILLPIIPLLLTNPVSKYFLLPESITLGQGYIILGYLTASYALAQFIAAPVLGQLSDKFGRRPILIISLFGTFLSYIVFALGIILKSLPILFIARIIDGITGGNISVAQAAIADITERKNRARNFGLIGAAFGLGFILGPYIGGKLSDPTVIIWFNATTPFWFASILSYITVILVIILFKETISEKLTKMKINFAKSVNNIWRAVTLKNIRTVLLTSFLVTGGFSFFTTFFAVYLYHKFNFTQGNVGDFFSYVGFWVVIAQVFVLPFFVKRFREFQILRFSLLGLAVFLFLNLFPTQAWQLLILTPFFAIFNGLSGANITALVSKSAEDNIQGEILGINASVQSLAESIPAVLSGYIAARFLPQGSIFVSALVLFVAWLVFLIFFCPKKACEWTAEGCH